MIKDNNILLTVAIPTYNRPITLEYILKQLSEEKNQSFYVLIADDYDAPSIKTRELVENFQKNNPRIIYYKNVINLGFSANVLHIYELVRTQYVWYLCDDEIVKPGCIDIILNTISTYKPRVAYFGFTQIDPYGREMLMLASKNQIICDKFDQFNEHTSILQGNLLSVVLFEKTALSLETIKATNYKDNVFIQLTMALYLLSDKFNFCLITTPIVHRNVGFKYGDFYKFNLVDVLKAVYAIEHKFDKKQFRRAAIRNIPDNFFLYLSQKLGLYRFSFHPTKQTIMYIVRFYGIFSVFVFAIPVISLLIPQPLVKLLYFARLTMIHGYDNACTIYRHNIDRAYTDDRDTGYTTYR